MHSEWYVHSYQKKAWEERTWLFEITIDSTFIQKYKKGKKQVKFHNFIIVFNYINKCCRLNPSKADECLYYPYYYLSNKKMHNNVMFFELTFSLLVHERALGPPSHALYRCFPY